MKKKVCVLTATRAEYGLLKPVIDKLLAIAGLDVRIVATGMHLSPEFGLTYQEIERDNIEIDKKIDILLSADTPAAISKTMGLALTGFADYFAQLQPDLLLVLGDRYETLAVCCVAMNQRIPIAHMYGGETTEGAVDEAIRHAITKLSYLHFTSTAAYRQRVIQLGEEPDRVFCVGATGIENILHAPLLSKSDLETALECMLDQPYGLVTFHPVTLEGDHAAEQFRELLAVCGKHQEMKFLFTKANADAHGRVINQLIDNYVMTHDNGAAFPSLGMTRYLSAMKYCALVIGNSSSGILEAPSFGVPTINIGDRQKGRVQAASILNCEPNRRDIEQAFTAALGDNFQAKARNSVNPYGNGKTSDKIVATIVDFLSQNKINLKKSFYDITGEKT